MNLYIYNVITSYVVGKYLSCTMHMLTTDTFEGPTSEVLIKSAPTWRRARIGSSQYIEHSIRRVPLIATTSGYPDKINASSCFIHFSGLSIVTPAPMHTPSCSGGCPHERLSRKQPLRSRFLCLGGLLTFPYGISRS